MKNRNSSWLVIISLIIGSAIILGTLFTNRPKISLPPQAQQLSIAQESCITTIDQLDQLAAHAPNNLSQNEVCQSLEDAGNEPITNTSCAISVDLTDQPYHLFFDLRHILLHSSGTTAAKAVGVSNMFWYTVKYKRTPNYSEIQARLFEFIDYCTKQPRGTALFNNEPMPGLMCQWARGELTAKQFLDTILSYKKEIKEFFVSEEEKNLVLGTLAVFKPSVICNIQRPISKMVSFFQNCCKDFANQIYILSNWDHESGDLIRKEFSNIFGLIKEDHIIFSGDIGMLKPETNIFKHITNKLRLDPKKCVLIDESPESIRVAKSLGWRTILHKDSDRTIRKVRKLLCIKDNLGKAKKKKK